MDITYGHAPTDKMLDPTTLAEMLRISDRHLTNVRKKDESFPAPKMLGNLPRWSPAAIHRWMDNDPGQCACSNGQLPAPVTPGATSTAPTKRKGAPRV